jgi:4-amino-4-deoxy-L-arabinose transferase-like glycosyltransferase
VRVALRHQAWIVLAAVAVFFTNLGVAGLWDKDEPLYAAVALDMHQRGDWVVPMFNGKLFPDKPPLSYWLMIVGYDLFGITEFAVRFWSAIFGIGTALVTYHLGRRLFGPEAGFWAGLVTASTLIFTVSARAATMDSVLVFLTTLAMFLFVTAGMLGPREPQPGAEGGGAKARTAVRKEDMEPDPARSFVAAPWLHFALLYACLGLAVLTKGPIGVVLPVAMLGFFLLVMHHLRSGDDWFERRRQWLAGRFPRAEKADFLRFGWQLRMAAAILIAWAVGLVAMLRPFRPGKLVRAAWQLRPITALVVVTAVAVPWYVLVDRWTGGEFTARFLGEQNFGRALNAMQGHSGPFWYYIPAILIGFFPWSVFMGPSLVELARGVRRGSPLRAEYVFIACWVGVFVAAWSVPTTKLPHYVLTAYPPLALATGCFIHGWIVEPGRTHPGWLRSGMLTTLAVGVGLLVGFPIAAMIFTPGEEFLGLFGVTLILGAGLFWFLMQRGRRAWAMASFAVVSVAFLVSIFGLASVRIDRFQNARPMMTEIRRTCPKACELAGYHFLPDSFVFYAGQRVANVESPSDIREFLEKSDNPFVLTTNKSEEHLAATLPGEFYVVARQRRFLRRGEVVILGRKPDAPSAQVASRAARSPVQ